MPLFLYGIGMAFIFSGIVWVMLTRRARSLEFPPSVGGDAGSVEGEDDHSDVSGLDEESDSRRESAASQRGVQALFSSDEGRVVRGSDRSRSARLSWRFLMDIVEWSVFMVVYAGLVQEYNSNVLMRLWIRESFPLAGLLLNYYALAAVGFVAGVLLFSLLLQKWRWTRIRE